MSTQSLYIVFFLKREDIALFEKLDYFILFWSCWNWLYWCFL